LAAIRDRLDHVEDIGRQEVRVATKTIDGTWAELHRHIDELEARADSDATETRARLQDRLDSLREQEASAWEAVREKAEAVDDQFRQLEIDIAIAENRLASEMADDATSFAEAVEAELHDWDAAIERLQTRAATKAQNAREQAEAEIAELKQARNRAVERLTAFHASPDAWNEQKNRVTEALDDLERKVREAALKIQRGEEHDD
jgi:chromosome segregation ATPase